MITEEQAERVMRKCKEAGADEVHFNINTNVVVVWFKGLKRKGTGERGSVYAKVAVTEEMAKSADDCARFVMAKAKEKKYWLVNNPSKESV